MAREAELFRSFGLMVNVRHVPATLYTEEGAGQEILGEPADLFHVPGHHPASLCLHFPGRGELYAGDTLFAGSIGRTDLPDGDHALLLRGIREKLFPLPDDTEVFPGHGPATTIGREKRTNPYL
jgi:glyoxylase-like metal-dependent hydrolase (beta-lactamase superfamily II)